MGKAQILDNLGNGQYTIRLLRNYDLLLARITWMNTRYAELQAERTPLATSRDDKIDELAQLRTELNSLIAAHDADNDLTEELKNKTTEILEKQTEISLLRSQITGLDAQMESIIKYGTQLEAIQDTIDSRTVWCADLSEDLTGEQTSIELNGVPDDVLLLPTVHPDIANIDSGELVPVLPMTPAQASFNFAIHPGWQKWYPTFRAGTITTLDGDTATVDLDAATDRYQGLDINQGNTVTAAIKYMTCDGYAFEVGDDVVVSFTDQNFSNPVVIGFQNNPRVCCFFEPWEADDSESWTLLQPPDNIVSDANNWQYEYRRFSNSVGYVWNDQDVGSYLFFNNKLYFQTPALDDGDTSIRDHYGFYDLEDLPVSKVRFTADARQACIPPNITDHMRIWFSVTGLKDGDRYAFYFVVFNSREELAPYERVGCTDTTATTTDWVESVPRAWWKGIEHNNTEFIDLPISGVVADQIVIRMSIFDINFNTDLRGGAYVVDDIAVC